VESDLYCSQPLSCSCQCCSSWLPPVAPTPSVPRARTASCSGASDGSSMPDSADPLLHSDSHDGQPVACSLSSCAAEIPAPHSPHDPPIPLGSPRASDNQQHCHGKSAMPLQDIQLTYGRRKRQRTAGNCSGASAKQKQTADYAWLQGADETPTAAPHHAGRQANMSSTLWCNQEAEQMTAAETSGSQAEGPDNTDGTLIWQVPKSV
jgi:hypothetical protein